MVLIDVMHSKEKCNLRLGNGLRSPVSLKEILGSHTLVKGAVAQYCAYTAMIDRSSWLSNRNRQKRRPATTPTLRDFVVFAGTSRRFVSSPTTSSLILKSIRQRLIEGTINTVNRSLCNYTRNQPNTFTACLEICDRLNGLC